MKLKNSQLAAPEKLAASISSYRSLELMSYMDEVLSVNLLVTIYYRASLFHGAGNTAGDAYWLHLVFMKDTNYWSQLHWEL